MTPDPSPEIESGSEPVAKRHRKRRSRKKLSTGGMIFLWIVGGLVTVAGVCASALYSGRPSVSPKIQAITASQAAIRARFSASEVVSFSPMEWTRVEGQPQNKYSVAGWGRVAGVKPISVSFTYNSVVGMQNGEWVVESLNMLPQ